MIYGLRSGVRYGITVSLPNFIEDNVPAPMEYSLAGYPPVGQPQMIRWDDHLRDTPLWNNFLQDYLSVNYSPKLSSYMPDFYKHTRGRQATQLHIVFF